MAALMDLRVFKLGLLVAGTVLMLSAIGVTVFGTKLGMIPANAVPVLSIMVWFACVLSVIRRCFRSKRPCEQFGGTADRTATCEMALSGKAWMLNPTTRKLTSPIASGFHCKKLISEPSGSKPYGVLLGEAGWIGPVAWPAADRDWALHKDSVGLVRVRRAKRGYRKVQRAVWQ